MSQILTGTKQSEEEAEHVDIEGIAPEPGVVVFTSKVHNLILTMFPELRAEVGGGQRPMNNGGFRLHFRNHLLQVNDALRREYTAFAKKYGQHHSIDEDDHQTLIDESLDERLRAHPCLNSSNPDGFFEVIAPIPDPSAELLAVLNAFADGDEEELERIQQAEIDGHKREKVLEACQKALESIYIARAASEAQAGAGEPPSE